MNHSAAHSRLVNDILIELGADARWRIWKNAVGTARSLDGKRVIHFGVEGSPDLYALIRGGILCGLEVKTGQADQSMPQKKFMQMIRAYGGHYGVVRSVQDARSLLSDWARLASGI